MRGQGRLALFTLAAIVGLNGLSVGLSRKGEDVFGASLIGGLLCLVAMIGAVIVARRDGHRIGWVLLGIAAFASSGNAAQSYAVASLIDGRALPVSDVAAWLALWLAMPAAGLFVFLVLLFPTGRLPSERWKPVAIATIVGTTGLIVSTALMPGPMPAIPGEANPLGLGGLRNLLTALSNIVSPILPLCALASAASQVQRLRSARGNERHQIKWVAYAMVLVPLLLFVSQMVLPQGASGSQWLEFAMNMAAATIIPVAIGVAMLRHRLYEIDVLINRTLVYGALTVAVASVYLALVVVLQAVLPIDTDSDISVAASTLASAALFRPLRTRIQAFIDRRFYRNKYSAELTMAGFAGRLREQVELDGVSRDLLDVVGQTVQPAHASLWLKAGSQ